MKLHIGNMLSGSCHRLSHVYRFSSYPVTRRESVAEHSYFVALYSYLIGMDLIDCGHSIDMGELLSRALVHDLDESMTGDFLRYVKYSSDDLKNALNKVSVVMIKRMVNELGNYYAERHWAAAKANDLEGEIIQVADLSSVISYVAEECKGGNKHVTYILTECCDYINKFIDANYDSAVVPYADKVVTWAKKTICRD